MSAWHGPGRDPAKLAVERFFDARYFVPKMQIMTREGKRERLEDATVNNQRVGMMVEQFEALETLGKYKNVCFLKARKLGITTIVQAWLVHRVVTWPNQYNVLCVGHEDGSCQTMNQMQQDFLKGLQSSPEDVPGAMGLGDDLFRQVRPSNTEQITIQKGTIRSTMQTLKAGGSGSGRSKTYRALHFTEEAFYRQGSAALGVSGKTSDETADYRVYRAAKSSLHEDESSRVIHESTADGPRGLFHAICLEAQKPENRDKWGFKFFPWFQCAVYQADPGEFYTHKERDGRTIIDDPVKYKKAWEAFQKSLTPDEINLKTSLKLNTKQLYWRRLKLTVELYDLQRFQKEYPATEEDPFLTTGGMWFPVELLNAQLRQINPDAYNKAAGWRRYAAYDPKRRYVIGGDPGGGVGKDQSTLVVLDDLGITAAVYSNRFASPHRLALEAGRASAWYNRPQIIAEKNNVLYGEAFLLKCQEMHLNLWVNANGEFWFSNTSKKVAILTELRTALEHNYLTLLDPFLIKELCHIREQDDGKIGADIGYNDDIAMSLALAYWAHHQFIKENVGRITMEMKMADIGARRESMVSSRVDRMMQILGQGGPR